MGPNALLCRETIMAPVAVVAFASWGQRDGQSNHASGRPAVAIITTFMSQIDVKIIMLPMFTRHTCLMDVIIR